jgi:hypothetical protein
MDKHTRPATSRPVFIVLYNTSDKLFTYLPRWFVTYWSRESNWLANSQKIDFRTPGNVESACPS